MEIITRYSGLKTRAVETRNHLKSVLSDIDPKSPTAKRDTDIVNKALTPLSQCANYLVFHEYYTTGETKLVKTTTCKKHLLCPFCASRRAAKNVKAYEEKIETLVTGRKELIPVMITFTVKNQTDLQRVFKHMRKSFKTLMQRRRINKHQGTHITEMRKVQGAVAAQELTFNEETNEWHPHIHMVAMLDEYIDIKKLSSEWHEITGDSFIVDIRRIGSKKPKKEGVSELSTGLVEVFKYALKFSDLPQEKLWEAYKFLRGKRMVSAYGDLYGIKIPETLLDDPYEDLPYIELFYTYSRKSKSYDLKTTTKHESIKDQELEKSKPREYELKSKPIKQSLKTKILTFNLLMDFTQFPVSPEKSRHNYLCISAHNYLCMLPGNFRIFDFWKT
jgi:plasmid rolling circle replication initiator protein Rep